MKITPVFRYPFVNQQIFTYSFRIASDAMCFPVSEKA